MFVLREQSNTRIAHTTPVHSHTQKCALALAYALRYMHPRTRRSINTNRPRHTNLLHAFAPKHTYAHSHTNARKYIYTHIHTHTNNHTHYTLSIYLR